MLSPWHFYEYGNASKHPDDTSKTVMFYEGARFHQQRFSEYGERLADLADLVREGLQISVERYDEARRYIAECQARVAEL